MGKRTPTGGEWSHLWRARSQVSLRAYAPATSGSQEG